MKLNRLLPAFGLLIVGCAGFISFVRYTSCDEHLSEDEILQVAKGHIEKEIDFLVPYFKESATDVLAGRFVLLSILDRGSNPFLITYQTRGGQLVDLEINVACGVRWSYPARIRPPLQAVFARDLRPGQPFVRRPTVTKGLSSVPGTDALYPGAIQLPDEPIRP